MSSVRDRGILHFLWDIRLVMIFYVLGDWITTVYAMEYGYEGNFFLSRVISMYGIHSILVLKLLFLVVLFWYYLSVVRLGSKWAFTMWDASKDSIAVLGIFLTVSNLFVIYFGNSLFQMLGVISSMWGF